MHQQNVLISGWVWAGEIGRLGKVFIQQPPLDHAVFLCRKDVCPDRQIIIVAIYEFEGQHEPSRVTLKEHCRKIARTDLKSNSNTAFPVQFFRTSQKSAKSVRDRSV